jgi:hypothetical protein
MKGTALCCPIQDIERLISNSVLSYEENYEMFEEAVGISHKLDPD